MYWLSIDGAKRVSGWALWDDASLVDHEIIRGLSPNEWKPILLRAEAIVLEDGFIGKGKSTRTGLVLARARGVIEGYAMGLGLEVWEPIHASRWRSIVGISTQLKRDAAKQAARWTCDWLSTPIDERPPPKKADSRWRDVHIPSVAGVPVDVAEAVLLGLACGVLQEKP